MRLKIRCDGESKKFCKIFWELNKALARFCDHALVFYYHGQFTMRIEVE